MVRFLISPAYPQDLLEGQVETRSAATLLGTPKRWTASGHMAFTQCILIQKGRGWSHTQEESVKWGASSRSSGQARPDTVTHRPKMSWLNMRGAYFLLRVAPVGGGDLLRALRSSSKVVTLPLQRAALKVMLSIDVLDSSGEERTVLGALHQ